MPASPRSLCSRLWGRTWKQKTSICASGTHPDCKQKHGGNTWDVTSSLTKAHTKRYGSITGRTLGKGMVAIHAIGSLETSTKKRWHGKEWHRGQGGMSYPLNGFVGEQVEPRAGVPLARVASAADPICLFFTKPSLEEWLRLSGTHACVSQSRWIQWWSEPFAGRYSEIFRELSLKYRRV